MKKSPVSNKKCEGDCKKHSGKVRTVQVVDVEANHDWGNFEYCETAISEDISRGLKVLER